MPADGHKDNTTTRATKGKDTSVIHTDLDADLICSVNDFVDGVVPLVILRRVERCVSGDGQYLWIFRRDERAITSQQPCKLKV